MMRRGMGWVESEREFKATGWDWMGDVHIIVGAKRNLWSFALLILCRHHLYFLHFHHLPQPPFLYVRKPTSYSSYVVLNFLICD